MWLLQQMAKKGTGKADSHRHQPTVHQYVNDEHDEDTLRMLFRSIHQTYEGVSMKA